jgi:Uma2 family endonuclease
MVAEQVYISPEVYLRQERDAAFKSEFIDGEIIEMAGASTNHNLIKENVAILVGMHVRTNGKGCRSMSSDQRVNVPTNSLYAYPDVVVVCGPNQYLDEQHDTLTNPTLIVEVLSPGTAAFDRGDKFALYRHSATLQEYMLVDSEKIRAEVFRKHPEAGYWFLADESDNLADAIALASIDFELSMTAVYAETEEIISR